MEWFEELWENPYLWSIFWSVAAAKVCWLMLDPEMFPGGRRFAPSVRSAAMASLVLGASYDYSWGDYVFALAVFVAIVVCSDAIHRRELGRQAAQINRLVQELKKHNIECDLPQEQLKEDTGCSLIQILLGIVVGMIATLIWPVFRI